MYDYKYLEQNLDEVREKLGPRGKDVSWDTIKDLLKRRKQLIYERDQANHLRKLRAREFHQGQGIRASNTEPQS